MALSVDHKPILPVEMQRIHESGGWVENCRVNGSLALSRALGDFKFKQNKKLKAERQIVTAYPDVEVHELDDSWDFILLASDGIWDVLTNDDVVELCLKKFEKCLPPEQICEEIMTECLSPDLLMTGTDNMTIVLTCFLHGRSYESFCKRAADYCQRLFPNDAKPTADETLECNTLLGGTHLDVGDANKVAFDADEESGESDGDGRKTAVSNGDSSPDEKVAEPTDGGTATMNGIDADGTDTAAADSADA